MPDAMARELIQRYQYLKTERTKWEPHWQDVNSMVNTRRYWWDDADSSGKTPDVKIYDSTAAEALGIFADGLEGYAVSPASRFFRLKMVEESKNRATFAQDWLEEVELQIYSALNMSTFYSSFNEFVRDAASTGTAFLFVEDDVKRRRINFSCRHPKECFISEDAYGIVDVLFRSFRLSLRGIVQLWGIGALDQSQKSQYEEQPDAMVTLLHAVYDRKNTEAGITKKRKRIASYYVDPSSERILDEGGYDEFPYLVWRYSKNSDEVYGRGIASQCLPEILRINQMAKTLLMAGELAVSPPLNIPMSMKGTERIIPRGYNYYTMQSGKIEPINLGIQVPFAWQEFLEQQRSLRTKFHVDFFLMLDSMVQRSQMTATEVMERQAEKAAVLGAMIGRLQSECLSPLIERVFGILQRDFRIPDPPPELAQAGGEIDIEYMGPLAQAQRRFQTNQGVTATLGLIQGLAQTEALAAQGGSQSIDNFNLDELAYQGAQAAGAPQKAVREKKEIAQLRAARMQAQAALMQQQAAMEAAQTAVKTADKPVARGSVLDRMGGGA